MKTWTNTPCGGLSRGEGCRGRRRCQAFTLVEAIVVFLLSVMVIASAISLCLAMNYNSARQANYTAAMSIAEGAIADLRSYPYNPPNYPFESATLSLTNTNYSIRLGPGGTNFMIPGTVISTIQPVGAYQHLVTVMWTNCLPGQPQNFQPLSVSLQAVVNKFSQGQNFQQ
jgi:hypothetical protein